MLKGLKTTTEAPPCKNLSGGLNRFYITTTLAFSSAVLYTRFLVSPRKAVQHRREHKNQTIQR